MPVLIALLKGPHMTTALLIILILVGIAALLVVFLLVIKSFIIVQQAQVVIIERFGKYHKILRPGINFIIPFFDTPRGIHWVSTEEISGRIYRISRLSARIDLRETVDDFPKQNVITKDNVTMEINALLYYQIMDPELAVYAVFNLPEAMEKLTQTTLRNVIGSLDLDQTLVSRDQINEKLRIILDEATDKWGVKVNRVELQEVKPPADILQAMEKQMRAERDRRATILEAEGKKRAAILEAEGFQESQVLRAKGDAESRVLHAEAEAQARLRVAQAEGKSLIEIKQSVPDGDSMGYMVAMQYIKTLPEMTKDKDGKMMVVPYEASSLMSSLSIAKTILEQKK